MLIDRIKGEHKDKLSYEAVKYPALVEDLEDALCELEYVGDMTWKTWGLAKLLMPYLEHPFDMFYESVEDVNYNKERALKDNTEYFNDLFNGTEDE